MWLGSGEVSKFSIDSQISLGKNARLALGYLDGRHSVGSRVALAGKVWEKEKRETREPPLVALADAGLGAPHGQVFQKLGLKIVLRRDFFFVFGEYEAS